MTVFCKNHAISFFTVVISISFSGCGAQENHVLKNVKEAASEPETGTFETEQKQATDQPENKVPAKPVQSEKKTIVETATVAASSFSQLPSNEEAVFWGSAEDEPPEVLSAQLKRHEGQHFLFSDEEYPNKYYETIKDLGGAYAGVGTDQGYLFIGWMKPNLAWLSDYDSWVILLHWSYFAFFENSENYVDFLHRWHTDNRRESVALLKKVYADHPDKKHIIQVFKHAQESVYWRMSRLQRLLKKEQIPSFVTDQEQYLFVRNLILAKRVRPIIGNLLAKDGLAGISEVSKKLNVPLRAFYLSNAEAYWKYTDQFRKNMYDMNYDEKSVIMRAFASKPRNGDYCYSTQSAGNFIEWLKQPNVTSIRQIWHDKKSVKNEDHIPFQHIDSPPKEAL